MTQKDLAEAIGITKNAITEWESGRSRPTGKNLEKLLIALETDSNTLFGYPLEKNHISFETFIAALKECNVKEESINKLTEEQKKSIAELIKNFTQ